MLSIIIVNYNGMKYLKGCFDSLYDKLNGIDFEIIVLDNNSADNSLDYIKQSYPDVRLIESSENLGFGQGNNAAVEKAGGKYLLLINNDTIVQDNLLPAIEYLEKDSLVGAVGIQMLDGKGDYLIAAGNFPSPFNLIRLKSIFRMGPEFRSGSFSKDFYDVDWLTGSFLLMPKKVYGLIGGFDKDYFMYGEDVDLCKKIADAGYRRVLLPRMRYIHFVGYNKSRDHLVVKGHEMYISKHFSGLTKVAARAAIGFNKLVKRLKKAVGR